MTEIMATPANIPPSSFYGLPNEQLEIIFSRLDATSASSIIIAETKLSSDVTLEDRPTPCEKCGSSRSLTTVDTFVGDERVKETKMNCLHCDAKPTQWEVCYNIAANCTNMPRSMREEFQDYPVYDPEEEDDYDYWDEYDKEHEPLWDL